MVQHRKFSGKELDDITGLYDHGARSRNPIIDPLFEKYPDFSPYNYCVGNPVKYFDPDGRRLFVKPQNTGAIKQSGYLYNHIKKVAHCEKNGVTPPLGEDKQPKKMYAGAFGGNHAEGNVQVAEQYLCIDQLNELDKYSNKEGTSVMHEMTEAFNDAIHAKEEGRNYGPAFSDTDPDYLRAHSDSNTIKQPPIERFENEDGSVSFKTYEILYMQGPNNTEIQYRKYHDLNY